MPAARRRLLGVERRAVRRRAAEPDREDERGGQLAAAGDLGELFEFAGRAERGERVGEGTAERFVYPVRAGCGSGPSGVCDDPDDKDVGLGRSGADSLVERETVTLPMLLHP